MEEKLPLIAHGQRMPAATRQPWAERLSLKRILCALALVLLAVHLIRWRRVEPRAGLITYAGEKIEWQRCGELIDRDLECSSIDVPMDHFNATNSGNKTFSIPLIRLRGKNATQNLFLNPGGPGGSGQNFLYRRGKLLNEIVGEGFHLLSFDPRGINGSRPRASCYPTDELRSDFLRRRVPKSLDESGYLYAWIGNWVKGCAETMGEHGAYLNTPQTAADMNSILDAVGQPNMVYWGFSYGTLLGQTYATLFPERSRRVIIDGVVNQFDWYEQPFDTEQFYDSDKVFRSFLDECFKARDNCSLAALAKDSGALYEKILDAVENLDDEPLSVYINTTSNGLLTRNIIINNGLFSALYKPSTWRDFSSQLAALLLGNATEAFLAFGKEPEAAAVEAFTHIILNDGLSGQGSWKQGRQAILDQLVPFTNVSLFAQSQHDLYFAKQRWAVPRTHGYVPRHGVQTAHPLLVLSTTLDPICPLVSARSALAAFDGSRLVEVQGYGHCSIAVPSLCLARHVRAFLYNGTLPNDHVQCEVDGGYFGDPDATTHVAVANPEERRIHAAQVALARDSWF